MLHALHIDVYIHILHVLHVHVLHILHTCFTHRYIKLKYRIRINTRISVYIYYVLFRVIMHHYSHSLIGMTVYIDARDCPWCLLRETPAFSRRPGMRENLTTTVFIRASILTKSLLNSFPSSEKNLHLSI